MSLQSTNAQFGIILLKTRTTLLKQDEEFPGRAKKKILNYSMKEKSVEALAWSSKTAYE